MKCRMEACSVDLLHPTGTCNEPDEKTVYCPVWTLYAIYLPFPPEYTNHDSYHFDFSLGRRQKKKTWKRIIKDSVAIQSLSYGVPLRQFQPSGLMEGMEAFCKVLVALPLGETVGYLFDGCCLCSVYMSCLFGSSVSRTSPTNGVTGFSRFMRRAEPIKPNHGRRQRIFSIFLTRLFFPVGDCETGKATERLISFLSRRTFILFPLLSSRSLSPSFSLYPSLYPYLPIVLFRSIVLSV